MSERKLKFPETKTQKLEKNQNNKEMIYKNQPKTICLSWNDLCAWA